MSFLDSIASIGKTVGGFISDSGIGSTLAKTALMGLALYQVNRSVNKTNDAPQEPTITETREQLVPKADNAVPVVYGSAFIRGIISDAYQQDQKYMWYCITICEKTGALNLGDGADSEFSFKEIYLNKGKITFYNNGITVKSTEDAEGNVNTDVDGLINIFCFKDGSLNPVSPEGYFNGSMLSAYGVFPSWTSSHTMNNLVFAIVRVEYVKEKNVTSLGEIEFKIENTMTEPGDCIYDYMTNTRYGAGIPREEINLV